MLRKIDRILLRVPSLNSAVAYYRDVLKMSLLRQDGRVASFRLGEGAELVLHSDADLPADATVYRVDDVRELYRRRDELRLTFAQQPTQATRGYRAAVKDPFGNVLLLIDRANDAQGSRTVEDGKPAGGALFAGVEQRVPARAEALIAIYSAIGRTADDLPYTPHFESLYERYAAELVGRGEARPSRREVWRHLLNLRKAGRLPKIGEARSGPPDVSAEDRAALRRILGEQIGRRDRLPYTQQFDEIVDQFNQSQARPLSPHRVWRLVATLAK